MSFREVKKCFVVLSLIACGGCFAPPLVLAQGPSDDGDDDPPKPYVSMSLRISPDDTAQVNFSAMAASGSAAELLPEAENLTGCKLTQGLSRDGYISAYNKSCKISAAKSGLLHTKTISLNRFTEAAKNHGVQFVSLLIELPETEGSELLPPAPATFPLEPVLAKRMPEKIRKQLARTSTYTWADLGSVPSAIRIQYGYRQGTVLRAAVVLVGFLFFPIVFVWWLGRRAVSAPQDRAPTVWFSYMRYLGWTLNLSLIGWLATIETLHCRELWQFIFAPGKSGNKWLTLAGFEALQWCMPVIFWVGCMILSGPVQEKLRGVSWTRRELFLQGFYTFCQSFLPLAMMLGGLMAMAGGAFRTAVLLFVGAIFAGLFVKGKLAKLLGMQPHALTSGDLRDVAFAIAGRMGVQLQQVYLIPSGKGRMANAFARTGNTIAFTDYLLSQMTKREVNFVIAHELTHLQKKHPNKLASIGVGAAIGAGMVVGSLRSFVADLSPFFVYGAIVALSTLITYAFTRRFEYQSDAGAVAATGDPEAAISALFKLAQLNLHPLQWSGWNEKWLTHPSILRRAKAVAKHAQIPEVSIPAIAARGVEPALHYTMPDETQRNAKVLSTANRAKTIKWVIFALLGVALLPPAIAACAAQNIAALAPYRYLLYGLGFVTAISLHFVIANQMPAWAYKPLEKRMKNRLESERGVQATAWGGVAVGLAPSDRPRTYEGMTHWDLGFLFLRSDRICYLGEEASFSLRYDQVTDMQLGPGSPSWTRNRRIYIAWKDETRHTAGVFSIAAASSLSSTKLNTRSIELFQQLNRWRGARAAARPLPDALANLETPQFREVTSQAPGANLRGGKLLNELFLTGLLGSVVAMLFGLPFHLMAYLSSLPLPGKHPFSGAGAGWYAVAASIAVRMVQIAPVFFYKDKASIAAPPVGGTAAGIVRSFGQKTEKAEELVTVAAEK